MYGNQEKIVNSPRNREEIYDLWKTLVSHPPNSPMNTQSSTPNPRLSLETHLHLTHDHTVELELPPFPTPLVGHL